MDVARATSALDGSRFARIGWVDETGSTNADLVARARAGEPEQVLGADHQTAGRGRLGRTWTAPPGASILMSVLVRPSTHTDPHLVTTALGLAAAEAVEEVAGRRLGIKWPNDLVAGTTDAPDDRKVAGVLAESAVEGGRIAAVVAGIGINVNWPSELPDELAATAASLNALVGHDLDRTDLVVALLRRLDGWLTTLNAPGGSGALRDAVVDRSATLGRTVRVERSAGELVGVASGLTTDGHLLVEADGVTHDVSVGDVIHLRPTE